MVSRGGNAKHAKRPQRRRARRGGCFCRLMMMIDDDDETNLIERDKLKVI